MRPWAEVSRHAPCTICGKPDWCARSLDDAWSICRRVDTGEGRHRLDKAGTDYWIYRSDGIACAHHAAPAMPCVKESRCADPLIRNRVYRRLLATLPLQAAHRQALRQRGLTDTEILRRGYRTLQLQGRAAAARRVVKSVGVDACTSVPGLYMKEDGDKRWWSLTGAPGLLIPVLDADGRIVALKVRADDPDDGHKYTYLSSAKYGGTGPGAPVHVPLHEGLDCYTVRLTEGELKADVATALSGMLTLSVPGVATWRLALPMLQHLRARVVHVAFDADWRINPSVAHALAQSAFALVKTGFEVMVEIWDITRGKGIDDLLAAGNVPTCKPATMAFSAGVRSRARSWTGGLRTIAASEVPTWH